MQARFLIPEVMDDPSLDSGRHDRALRGLERLNFLSFAHKPLWQEIRKLSRIEGSRPLRILDIATGAGDTPIRLLRQARHENLPLEIHGCDKSEQALTYARLNAKRHGAGGHFFRLDVLEEPLPAGYDVLMCSLFLHHLAEPEAVLFLRKMTAAARCMVMISDLRRSRAGLWLAAAAAHLFTRSAVVHFDAPQSVRAAFTIEEVSKITRAAGWPHFQIWPVWPFRYLLTGTV